MFIYVQGVISRGRRLGGKSDNLFLAAKLSSGLRRSTYSGRSVLDVDLMSRPAGSWGALWFLCNSLGISR